MSDIILLIIIFSATGLGYILGAGKWKEALANEQANNYVYVQSLKILLDTYDAKLRESKTTIDVLKEELQWKDEWDKFQGRSE